MPSVEMQQRPQPDYYYQPRNYSSSIQSLPRSRSKASFQVNRKKQLKIYLQPISVVTVNKKPFPPLQQQLSPSQAYTYDSPKQKASPHQRSSSSLNKDLDMSELLMKSMERPDGISLSQPSNVKPHPKIPTFSQNSVQFRLFDEAASRYQKSLVKRNASPQSKFRNVDERNLAFSFVVAPDMNDLLTSENLAVQNRAW